jgi:basic amino acid/polyamine antiporter, APA family
MTEKIAPVPEKEDLKREIGIRPLILAMFNNMIGTGIFVIPAIVAESLGTAAIIAYLVCGFLIFLIALCFAEVGSKVTVSGGVYAYIETAFGPYAGFISNNLYWIGACVIADAALANAFADTLKYFFPLLSNEILRIFFFVFIFGTLAFFNIKSVRNGVRFMEIATVGKIVPLIVLVIVGFSFISGKNLHWTSSLAIGKFGAATLLLFFAFMGMEGPLSNSGEIKNAKRNVPLGLILGISGVLILYVAIQIVTQGVLGPAVSAHKGSPLTAVAGIIFGKTGAMLIIITTAVSVIGTLGGDILAIPRILYAGGRDGLLPRRLARVHPKFLTPYVAVLTYASLGLLFAIFGGFRQLAILASASTLLIYLGVVLSTIKLRSSVGAESEKTFQVPGGIIVPVLAICVIVWLLSNLSKQEITGITIFLIVLSLIYIVSGQIRKKNLRKANKVVTPSPIIS